MEIEVTRLENGIRVVTDRMPQVETVSLAAHFDIGARGENPRQNGITHLLEHMAFKGTRQRSARAIAEEIEAVGGQLNAYTTREQTTFYARVMKGDLGLAVDILSDILQHSIFEAAELSREKDVILQEIAQAHDTPDDMVFDKLQQAAYPDQSLGRSILGTPECIRAIDRDTLKGYLERHYVGSNLVVAAAGNLEHDAVVEFILKTLGDLPKGQPQQFDAAQYGGGECRVSRDLEQLHIALAFPALHYRDPDYYALQVYSVLVGGGMSSRLFQRVREEMGLAYSVYSFAASHKDSGIFGIYAGTSPTDAAGLLPVIAEELASITREVSSAELERARSQLKAGLLMSLESTVARAEQLGRQMLLFDRPIETAELIAKVEAVDDAAVRRIGTQLLQGSLTLAAVGRHDGLGDFDQSQAIFRTDG